MQALANVYRKSQIPTHIEANMHSRSTFSMRTGPVGRSNCYINLALNTILTREARAEGPVA